jgi:hypothetical protein
MFREFDSTVLAGKGIVPGPRSPVRYSTPPHILPRPIQGPRHGGTMGQDSAPPLGGRATVHAGWDEVRQKAVHE